MTTAVVALTTTPSPHLAQCTIIAGPTRRIGGRRYQFGMLGTPPDFVGLICNMCTHAHTRLHKRGSIALNARVLANPTRNFGRIIQPTLERVCWCTLETGLRSAHTRLGALTHRCGQEIRDIPAILTAMPTSHCIFRKNFAIHKGAIQYQSISGGLPIERYP